MKIILKSIIWASFRASLEPLHVNGTKKIKHIRNQRNFYVCESNLSFAPIGNKKKKKTKHLWIQQNFHTLWNCWNHACVCIYDNLISTNTDSSDHISFSYLLQNKNLKKFELVWLHHLFLSLAISLHFHIFLLHTHFQTLKKKYIYHYINSLQ